MKKRVDITDFIGKIFTKIKVNDVEIIFECKEYTYIMYHEQDCCERVYVESVVGDITDLLESPILLAEEVTSNDPEASESATWTFYKLATRNGYVDIRWYGSSNGYYSERVHIKRINNDNLS